MTPAPKTWNYGSLPWLPEADRLPDVAPRTRVIIDNDFAGDPDDLFALAHHLLVEGTEVRGVVISRLREDDPGTAPAPPCAPGMSASRRCWRPWA
ncbi:hypothetical protein [Actinomyces ruminis]|uniref:Inosine-uridine preferring nucleoside hydrolase n=1 Tax=Actinomyces ruminis TaxID=1937003 RepID=A0ABX4MBH7_9ACTO|nr:hypothetical protein [Actinomyces ruminis]PHP52840.1 hypothetical protein BW737_006960 [Actinomyces ruminis]